MQKQDLSKLQTRKMKGLRKRKGEVVAQDQDGQSPKVTKVEGWFGFYNLHKQINVPLLLVNEQLSCKNAAHLTLSFLLFLLRPHKHQKNIWKSQSIMYYLVTYFFCMMKCVLTLKEIHCRLSKLLRAFIFSVDCVHSDFSLLTFSVLKHEWNIYQF